MAVTLSRGKWKIAPHLALLSDGIADAIAGITPRLIVTMPPRHGKSMLVSQYTPVWFLENWPDKRVILASYAAEFAASWGRKVRNTIAEYSDILRTRLSGDNTAVDRWTTKQGGGMDTVGVRGPVTGKGANLLLVDDPVKSAEEADSETYRARAWEWWQGTLYPRLEPRAAVIIVMTRWHQEDLAGKLIEQSTAGGEQWKVINCPALAEEGDTLGRPLGAPLWPERYDLADFDRIRASVGSRNWNAQYQQRPAPAEGGIIKRHWWRYWDERTLPKRFDQIIMSWDMAFKDTKTSDYVVGQVWGRKGADKYLLDQVRDRLDFVATETAVERLALKWPMATAKYVEEKANGAGLIARLRSKISGLIPVNPTDSKTSRVYAVTPEIESANVFLPHPLIRAWVNDFVEECAAFPNAAHDDQVDCMTQALQKMQSGSNVYLSGSLGY